MRKVLAVLLFSIVFTPHIIAQNNMRIGVNLGANVTDFKGFFYVEDMTNAQPGFLVGVSFEYYLTNKLSLKANLNYERKSYKDKYPGFVFGDETQGLIGDFKNTVHYNFLSLPILAKYDIGQSNRFYTNVGPNFNYRVNTIVKTTGVVNDKSTLTGNQLDLALLAGFGIKFHLDEINDLNLELRYSHDVTNISKERNVEDPIQANTLSLVLSWNLAL